MLTNRAKQRITVGLIVVVASLAIFTVAYPTTQTEHYNRKRNEIRAQEQLHRRSAASSVPKRAATVPQTNSSPVL
ncbi:hypothetical protein HKX48_009596 [Thoreauomyces humboldtii]|nr:hypothetical protein HKX48_009596 [Thoreauomyces humboldtii]